MNAGLLAHLQEKTQLKPLRAIPLSGGDINDVYLLKGDQKSLVVKVNDKDRFPGIFETEAKGLNLLRENGGIYVPRVIETGSHGSQAYLLLEFVEPKAQHHNFWEAFGVGLAQLHQITSEQFGLDHHNYIGSLFQTNTTCESWEEFFITQRLEPQLKMAVDAGLGSNLIAPFNRFFSKLDQLFPNEKPALLHGDLWSGNYMKGPEGEPCIYDPAVYFGHREMDLAMTKLFGGFDAELYHSYHNEYPLELKWQERVDYCNLYPLLVHVNLFGGGYVSQVGNILKRF